MNVSWFWNQETKTYDSLTAYIWKYKILVHDHSWRRCFCLSIHFHKISVKLHAMTKIHLSLISSIATCPRTTIITLTVLQDCEQRAACVLRVFVSTSDYLSFQFVKTMTYIQSWLPPSITIFEILQLFILKTKLCLL